MNYYPHHIGDFNSATRHLTRIERSIYRDLLELYYDTEQALIPDLGKLCRLVIARTDEERTAVEQVLNEFFTETEQGWSHSRCEAEIAKYHGNKEAKSAAGKASAAKRAQKSQQQSDSSSTGVQQVLGRRSTNQEPEPITKNQEPEEQKAPASERPPVPAKPAKPQRAKPVKVPMPEGFRISDAVQAWAEREGHTRHLQAHFEHFVGAALAKGYVYVNWDQALMNAIRDNWAKVGQQQPSSAPRAFSREAENERRKAEFLERMRQQPDLNVIDMEPHRAIG